MTIQIRFIGTETYYANWNKDPIKKAQNICDYCARTWHNYIPVNKGHRASFKYFDKQDVEIPDAVFQTQQAGCRLSNQWKWLKNNWAKCSSTDAVVVIDYFKDTTLGLSSLGTAGSKQQYIATINMWPENSNSSILPPFPNSEVVAQHEMCHLFNANHPHDVSLNANTEASIMYSPCEQPDAFGCTKPSDYSGDPQRLIVGNWHSSCAQNSIRAYIDSTYP